MNLGVIIRLREETDLDAKIKEAKEMGFDSVQFTCWQMERYTDETAETILNALNKYGVRISTFWCGWRGKESWMWNSYEGPLTLGIVPPHARFERILDLKKGSDFAKKLGVDQIATHAGFIPEDPNTELYREAIVALREVAAHCKKNGQYFLFETGQETPFTLARAIEDIGLDNLGVNLDPANLILYGKANPIDSLYLLGKYIRDVHAKDGVYPDSGHSFGKETPLGQGHVNFPKLIARLKECGYDGPITIEREIHGEQQIKDIRAGKAFLEQYI